MKTLLPMVGLALSLASLSAQDASRPWPTEGPPRPLAAREVNFVTVAAAEGLKAAFAINRELRREQTQRRETLDPPEPAARVHTAK